MKGYIINIENESRKNKDYRRVLYTAKNSQLVLMNIAPNEEIGEEVHHLDQFLRFEEGDGKVVIDGVESNVMDGDAVVIPGGTLHNVINIGNKPLKLYTVYSPPEHKEGTIHQTKSDEKEEHFDGITTE